MKSSVAKKPFVAIACGGTGGHLFPGLAVAEQLQRRGCEVALLISPKDIDQQAVKTAPGMEVFTLPAVGLQNRNYFSFAKSFGKSFLAARKIFKRRKPVAVLAMGGFTSAPPVLAGKMAGAKTFLHESNTIPGKANRFLARFVDVAFTGFPETAARLKARRTEITGTPVRPQFQIRDLGECRVALGLDPNLPTILVVGGSQGASALNEMILSALPSLSAFQFFHLTGARDFEKVQTAYQTLKIKAVVKPFFTGMDLALGAATVCVSRAGASSLAEIAALRLPSVLVPLPTAADNHQYFNALAYEKTGAAHLISSQKTDADRMAKTLAELVSRLVENAGERARMQSALAQWHAPKSAEQIATRILESIAMLERRSPTRRVETDVCLNAPGRRPALRQGETEPVK
jgi:UDP-N-acetylglucosamine--N-acetylmuramyl-(pentapeptide) pyrophosphoryl-undecaprenol N-acetylglucosamine transferase